MSKLIGSPAGNEEQAGPLPDVQSLRDERNIPIDRVGVRNVRHPITVRQKRGGTQRTVGTFTLTVDLPRHFKGTHMSRFLEVLENRSEDLSSETIPEIVQQLRNRLVADTAHLDVTFDYFLEKRAPVTGARGLMGYQCGFFASGGSVEDILLHALVPVTTLCPCSKTISSFGAHNQRGYVTVKVRPSGLLWLEDLIELIEQSASAPLYPVLKRPDEKFVTEQAYSNPRFVEDMVREVSVRLDAREDVVGYEIEVENHESIHDHNAYACLSRWPSDVK